MNNKDNNNQVSMRALELLPWYVLGLLSSEEKQFVEKSLLESSELQEHLRIEHKLAQCLHEEKELFSLSAIEDKEKRLGQLLQRAEFQPKKPEQQEVKINTRLVYFFQSLFSGNMRKSQYIGFAAVTTLSIALLFAVAIPLLERSSTFYPAAIESEGEKLDINTLLIGLNVAPDDPRLVKILNSYNTKVTTIAGKDGMYRLNFINNTPSGADLDQLLSTLSKETELIWFVGEAY